MEGITVKGISTNSKLYKAEYGYESGECTFNAPHLAESENLTYVEGYVATDSICFAHCWNIGYDGEIIDVSLEERYEGETFIYYSVIIDENYVESPTLTYTTLENFMKMAVTMQELKKIHSFVFPFKEAELWLDMVENEKYMEQVKEHFNNI